MADPLEPKDVKLLADILALVLEDQPGASEAALAILRRRAREQGTSGGAIKNLFLRLTKPPEAATVSPDLAAARAAIRELETVAAAQRAELSRLRAQVEAAASRPQTRLRLGMPRAWIAAAVAGVALVAAMLAARSPVPPPAEPAPDPMKVPRAAESTLPLSPAQRVFIADHVHACWDGRAVPGMGPGAGEGVVLVVRTDQAGVARAAWVDAFDRDQLANPGFAALAAGAVRAVLDPRCAHLPLPAAAAGQAHTLSFRFIP